MASDFKRPIEWEDNDRMNFLMSPFPPNNTRPSLSDPKVIFWRDLITSSSRDLSQWTFTKREISHRLSWQKMESKCLPLVVDTLERGGALRRLSGYRIEGIGWMEWGLKLVSYPVTWAWQRYVTTSPSEETSDDIVYVLVSTVKELCDHILNVHFESVLHVATDCVMTHYDFEQLLQREARPANKRSLLALELNLLEEQKITKGSLENSDEVVVKFAANRRARASPVTDMDIGLLSIQKTINDLRNKLKRKSEDIQSLRKRSLECKRKGNNSEAITYFKKMKTIQKATSNLELQLNNLDTIVEQIQTAETNAKVISAYESGVLALKQIKDNEGVTVEKAEELMDDMQELLEEGDRLGETLATAGHVDPFEVDEAELLKELEELESVNGLEDQMKSISLQDPLSVPSPPSTSPSSHKHKPQVEGNTTRHNKSKKTSSVLQS